MSRTGASIKEGVPLREYDGVPARESAREDRADVGRTGWIGNDGAWAMKVIEGQEGSG